MIIKLWKNFSKRSNSTKQPSTAGIEINAFLKQPTSIESPSFIIQSRDFEYNYCQAFGHYYFITDITSINNDQIKIDCKQDVLATWRDNIRNSTQFIMYSASDYNVWLPDSRITMQADLSKAYYNATGTPITNTGCYALTIANDSPGGTGLTTTYILTSSQITELAKYFNSTLTGDALAWLQNRFLNPFDAIISCIWLPIAYNSIAASEVQPKIGKDVITDITGNVKRLAPGTMVYSDTSLINFDHDIEDFRISAPYEKMQLYIPFYGFYDLNPIDFNAKVKLKYYIDLVSGDTTIYICSVNAADTDFIRNTINFNMGVTCALSQVTRTGDGAVASLGGVAGGVLTAVGASTGVGVATGIITATASAGNAAISANNVTTSVKGSISGRSMIYELTPYLMITHYASTDPAELTTTQGRPLMAERLLSTLSGFCQCADASVSIPGLSGDRDEINSLLNSGIYLE